jgi:hypothetical protein
MANQPETQIGELFNGVPIYGVYDGDRPMGVVRAAHPGSWAIYATDEDTIDLLFSATPEGLYHELLTGIPREALGNLRGELDMLIKLMDAGVPETLIAAAHEWGTSAG